MGVYFWVGYFVLVNLVGLLCMWSDKRRARRKKWRIPEKNLFGIAAFGGSIGCIAGMQLFRHKTKHKIFVIGMPLILILQLAAGALWWYF